MEIVEACNAVVVDTKLKVDGTGWGRRRTKVCSGRIIAVEKFFAPMAASKDADPQSGAPCLIQPECALYRRCRLRKTDLEFVLGVKAATAKKVHFQIVLQLRTSSPREYEKANWRQDDLFQSPVHQASFLLGTYFIPGTELGLAGKFGVRLVNSLFCVKESWLKNREFTSLTPNFPARNLLGC